MPRKNHRPAVDLSPAMRHFFETGEQPGSTPRSCGLAGWFALLVEILPRPDADAVLEPYRAAFRAEGGIVRPPNDHDE